MPDGQSIAIDFIDRPRTQATYNRAYTLTLKVYSDGTQQVPTSATIDVKRPGGAALTTAVSGATVTVDGAGTMTYAVAAGNTDLLAVNYSALWKPVISGVTYDFPQLFDVVRHPLRNVVRQADLVLHHPDLTDLLFSGESNYQGYIEQAYEDVFMAIDAKGFRPALFSMDATAFRRSIEHLALHKILVARLRGEEDRWAVLSEFHRKEYERWSQAIRPVYDADESGTADGTSTDGKAGEEGGASFGMRYRL